MDKNKKKPMKEANLNSTVLIKPNVFRSKLNETISVVRGPRGDENFGNFAKPKQTVKKVPFQLPPPLPPVSSTKVSHMKFDLEYNEYLQTLLKQDMIQNQIKENKTVLDGQLQYYSDVLNQKQQTLKEVHNETELIKKQSEIVEVLQLLEEKLEKMKTFFIGHQVGSQTEVVQTALEKECDKVFLKNIKPISTQEDYNKLVNTLRNLQCTMDKIMNSGVNFEDIHTYAEEIRNFLQLQENVKKSQNELEKIELDGIRMFITKLSDMFAKQYENKLNNSSEKL